MCDNVDLVNAPLLNGDRASGRCDRIDRWPSRSAVHHRRPGSRRAYPHGGRRPCRLTATTRRVGWEFAPGRLGCALRACEARRVSRAAHRWRQAHRGVTAERRPRATDDPYRRPRSRPQPRPDLRFWSRLLRSAPRPAGVGGPHNDPVGASRWLGRSAGIVVRSGWGVCPTHVVPALVAFALCNLGVRST